MRIKWGGCVVWIKNGFTSEQRKEGMDRSTELVCSECERLKEGPCSSKLQEPQE